MTEREVSAMRSDFMDVAGSELVYPVYSRRSGGLSLGINLFPEGKHCNFDCPYCEVFPSIPGKPFSLRRLEEELTLFFRLRRDAEFPGTPVNDICISGRGEPSLSPFLEKALYAAAAARGRYCPEAKLVLITNSTGFMMSPVFEVLHSFANKVALTIWAKLDAGTEEWYRAMSGSTIPLVDIIHGLQRFAQKHRVTIQTMICKLDGNPPNGGEIAAYASRLEAMLDAGADIEEVQLYTQARPSPGGRTAAVSDAELSDMAQRVRETTQGRIKLSIYGERG